jgi:hypothetical protein
MQKTRLSFETPNPSRIALEMRMDDLRRADPMVAVHGAIDGGRAARADERIQVPATG